MSIIRATINATKGTFADQYKEFISCDEMGMNVLVRRGEVLRAKDNTNAGRDNVITDGSGIVVNEGQCMIIVENGKIVDFCNEPGKYIYNNDLTPSMLTGGMKGMRQSFSTVKERMQSGGQRDNDQRVYYINTKELMSNKFGVGQVPFRDSEFNFTIKISAFGEYSYRITDPIMFFTNVSGNVDKEFTRDKIDSQFKSEIQASLQPALGRIALKKIAYDQLPLFTREIGEELNLELTKEWVERRGLSVESFAIASVTPDGESAKKIEEFQSTRVYTDASMLGARMGTAQAEAMVAAANNTNGAMGAFMGMGMAQNSGGNMNPADLLSMGQEQKQKKEKEVEKIIKKEIELDKSAKDSWDCDCGASNTGKFCSECGGEKVEGWKCTCGNINTGKFCPECGSPEATVNRCKYCDFTSEDSFKFCPECGTIKE